jgi:formyltetrahydrofolate deformylase
METDKHVILIDCTDEKGLVFRITEVLYRHGLNIISNQEFVDPTTKHFFMRTALEELNSPGEIVQELRCKLPEQARIRHAVLDHRPIVIMATNEPHCLGDLLIRHQYGEIPAHIEAVVSNHDQLCPLVRAFGIPFHHVSHEGLDRRGHEENVLKVLAKYSPEYIVLAKYMRIFTPSFISHFPARILNIHHSFLPAFVGASPYTQAYERGVKIIGATAHMVTENLDAGPIIAQDVLHVDHSHTASEMAQAGKDVEKIVLAKALRLVMEERVFIHNSRTIIFD